MQENRKSLKAEFQIPRFVNSRKQYEIELYQRNRSNNQIKNSIKINTYIQKAQDIQRQTK